MTGTPDENLERLISRFLDREDTAADRRALNARVDADSTAQALLDEQVALDNEVRRALRQAMRRSYPTRVATGSVWNRIGRSAALAAAACLVILIWFSPGRQPVGPANGDKTRKASLFATPSWHNLMQQERPPIERPHVQQRNLKRDWLVIPGRRPNQGIVVIEVNRIRTRAIAIHQDF